MKYIYKNNKQISIISVLDTYFFISLNKALLCLIFSSLCTVREHRICWIKDSFITFNGFKVNEKCLSKNVLLLLKGLYANFRWRFPIYSGTLKTFVELSIHAVYFYLRFLCKKVTCAFLAVEKQWINCQNVNIFQVKKLSSTF